MKLFVTAVALLLLSLRGSFAEPLSIWFWSPSDHEQIIATALVEHYCRFQLSDQKKSQTESQQMRLPLRLNIPEDFSVYGVRYSAFKIKCVPFVILDFDSNERKFIAVQHFAPKLSEKSDSPGRSFTLYYEIGSGYVGYNLGNPPVPVETPPFCAEDDELDRKNKRTLTSQQSIGIGGTSRHSTNEVPRYRP